MFAHWVEVVIVLRGMIVLFHEVFGTSESLRCLDAVRASICFLFTIWFACVFTLINLPSKVARIATCWLVFCTHLLDWRSDLIE